VAKLAGSPANRAGARKIVVVICLLTIGALFAGVARQSLGSNGAAQDVVELEADGATIMHSMTSLLTELVTAQSAAVRGQRVDQEKVRTSVSALFAPDAEYGAALLTSQRLTDLRNQVEAAFSASDTGLAAYETWSSIVDLALDLINVIGDTSHLIHDPDLDSYYLMDSALVRLPNAMVYAGRASDLVALAGGSELAGEDLVRAAVARFNVSSDAERVSAGLTASVDFTARSELGTNVAQRLDEFRAAADEFAPPTMLRDLATQVDAGTMADNASLVFAKAASLSHLLISELQQLLAVRLDRIEQQRRATLISSVAGALIAVIILWLVLVARSSGRTAGSLDEKAKGARGIASVGFHQVGPEGPRGDLAGSGAWRSGHAQ
jgi:hypothetical protein